MKSKSIRFSVLLSTIFLIVSPAVIYSKTCIQNFAPKPPLGFNSFDSYRSHLTEDKAYAFMDVMAEKYLPFGYEYFVMDAGWYSTMNPERHQDLELESFGVCVVCQEYFPNGIKVLADYAHQKGLKFGVWIMRGIPRRAVEQNPPSGGCCVF